MQVLLLSKNTKFIMERGQSLKVASFLDPIIKEYASVSLNLLHFTLHRTNFHLNGLTELLPEMEHDFRGSSVGVVVCGPETMKESVASACQQNCRKAFKINSMDRKEHQPLVFSFHSLSFSL